MVGVLMSNGECKADLRTKGVRFVDEKKGFALFGGECD